MSLWQCYRDEPTLTYAGDVANFHAANSNVLFKFKKKVIGKTKVAAQKVLK